VSARTEIQRLLTSLDIIGKMSREEFNRRVEAIGLKDPEPSRRRKTSRSPLRVGPASPEMHARIQAARRPDRQSHRALSTDGTVILSYSRS
jgi:hypothetical protein